MGHLGITMGGKIFRVPMIEIQKLEWNSIHQSELGPSDSSLLHFLRASACASELFLLMKKIHDLQKKLFQVILFQKFQEMIAILVKTAGLETVAVSSLVYQIVFFSNVQIQRQSNKITRHKR